MAKISTAQAYTARQGLPRANFLRLAILNGSVPFNAVFLSNRGAEYVITSYRTVTGRLAFKLVKRQKQVEVGTALVSLSGMSLSGM